MNKGSAQQQSRRQNPEQRRHGDGRDLGFINRMQIQQEGGWDRLAYPRSNWLLDQLGGPGAPGATAGTPATCSTAVQQQQRAEERYAALTAAADFTDGTDPHGGGGGGLPGTGAGAGASGTPGTDGTDGGGGGGGGGGGHGDPCSDPFFRACATVVGLDRNAWAAEQGYETRLRSMQGCVTGKTDILIGFLT